MSGRGREEPTCPKKRSNTKKRSLARSSRWGELEASGGFHDITYGELDDDRDNCVRYWHRQIYGGNGFPNCAATVGADSSCWRNDGCYNGTVVYDGMRTDCGRTCR